MQTNPHGDNNYCEVSSSLGHYYYVLFSSYGDSVAQPPTRTMNI